MKIWQKVQKLDDDYRKAREKLLYSKNNTNFEVIIKEIKTVKSKKDAIK